jgi:hypothetical protein
MTSAEGAWKQVYATIGKGGFNGFSYNYTQPSLLCTYGTDGDKGVIVVIKGNNLFPYTTKTNAHLRILVYERR